MKHPRLDNFPKFFGLDTAEVNGKKLRFFLSEYRFSEVLQRFVSFLYFVDDNSAEEDTDNAFFEYLDHKTEESLKDLKFLKVFISGDFKDKPFDLLDLNYKKKGEFLGTDKAAFSQNEDAWNADFFYKLKRGEVYKESPYEK